MSLFAFNKMQANPDKLQEIAISSKTHKQNIECDLYGSKINCDDNFSIFLCIIFGTKMPCERTIASIS
jgi:hypothetical protein